MRVIAGEFRSRKLRAVPGMCVRPTPDRLREALFSVLAPRIAGALFVDAYAGTGAVGIEALSRGAAKCVFLEQSRTAIRILEENLAVLGISRRAVVIAGKAVRDLTRYQADIVFLDPPYDQAREYEECLAALGAAPPPLVIVQHASREELKQHYGKLGRYRVLRQGDNSLSFYAPAE
jgi:16S rRNA (guanine(966)-N(2))-methyltransferase RsmD